MIYFSRFKVTLLFFSLTAILGCSAEEAQQLSSVINRPTNPTVGDVTDDSMYVRLYDSGAFLSTISKRSDPAKACSIAKGANKEIITCDLRISEYDLYINPITLQVNIPSGMCDYYGALPYYYYNWEPGNSSGNVTINLSSSVKTCSTTDVGRVAVFSDDKCTVSQSGREIYSVTSTGVITSPYDHSNSNGPNCAQGKVNATVLKKIAAEASAFSQGITYQAKTTGTAGNSITVALVGGGSAGSEVVTVNGSSITVSIASGVSTQANVVSKITASTAASALVTATASAGSSTVATAAAVTLAGGSDKDELVVEQKFSGKYGDCLAGPPINSMTWPKLTNGYPAMVIKSVGESGTNELFEMKAIIDIGRIGSLNIANGYNYGNLFMGDATVYGAKPEIFRPFSTSVLAANEFYKWYCLDASGEVKYQINFVIHEFNTTAEFNKWYESNKSNTSVADPDIVGLEGAGCDYVTADSLCNDLLDIDDIFAIQFPMESNVK